MKRAGYEKYCIDDYIVNKLKACDDNQNYNIDFIKTLCQILATNLNKLSFD
ncbi:MAG: hypothetical protein ACRC34_04045 [Cetobacterium sp.]